MTEVVITTGGVVLVGALSLAGVVYQSRKTRGQLNTGNGHTIGEGIARIEEILWRHENRLDSIEVEVRESSAKLDTTAILSSQSVKQMEDHLLEIAPLREWVADQMKGEE